MGPGKTLTMDRFVFKGSVRHAHHTQQSWQHKQLRHHAREGSYPCVSEIVPPFKNIPLFKNKPKPSN